MARGGPRQNAGRKRGVPNKASKAREEIVAASGVTPLEVMLERMRHHYAKAQAELKAKNTAEAEKHMREADDAARAAAPYVHPKLSSVEMSGGLTISHEDALEQLAPTPPQEQQR